MDGPSFAEKLGPALGSQAFLAAGTPLAATNLLGISFAWTVKPHMDAAACNRMASDALPMRKELPPESLQGRAFQRGMEVDDDSCPHKEALLDATWFDGGCVFFERDLQTACPDAKSPEKNSPLTPTQRSQLQRQLDSVMASVSLR